MSKRMNKSSKVTAELGLLFEQVIEGNANLKKVKLGTLIVDKMVKNHVNAINYRKLPKDSKPIEFFEE